QVLDKIVRQRRGGGCYEVNPALSFLLTGLADLVATELWLRRVRARRHGACWTGLPLPEHTALTPPRFG
ncbi:arylamine N-acetyltransferase, partial [Kitasatospora sp. NPDC001574]